jgi:UDP-N-acetylglucosamine--N-acetylmuramyl-(pentapeptide) pyrophosphoryl-undecaprenol N-acetylglucosamine transferase
VTKRIVLTGGGTAGHVMPNLALLPQLRAAGFDVVYIGSAGVEKGLVTAAHVPFYEISTGKLRRYFSVQNVLDVGRIIAGFFQALILMMRLRPHAVFSKGGFVAVPVTLAAWCFGVPVVTHESDYSPGLANKIITPFSRKILYTFPETAKFLPKERSEMVGTPVRQDLFSGDAERGRQLCGFGPQKPILLVMGGSQGAQRINEALRSILPELTQNFNVVHITGKGKSIGYSAPGYVGFEFVGEELKDVFAATDIVVTRAGANSIFEILALKKPMLLIPLEVGSRGDQVLNAKSFAAKGWALTLSESKMTGELLAESIKNLAQSATQIVQQQSSFAVGSVPARIVEILGQISR